MGKRPRIQKNKTLLAFAIQEKKSYVDVNRAYVRAKEDLNRKTSLFVAMEENLKYARLTLNPF